MINKDKGKVLKGTSSFKFEKLHFFFIKYYYPRVEDIISASKNSKSLEKTKSSTKSTKSTKTKTSTGFSKSK